MLRLRPLQADPVTSFVSADGEIRELRDPLRPASPGQLVRLNAEGLLAIVRPGQVEPISKGEASGAIGEREVA